MSRVMSIFGRKGKGKTTLAMKLANEENRGTLAFDPSGAIEIGLVVYPGPSFETRMREATEQNISPVVVKTEFGDDIEESFDSFARFAYSLERASIVVDEASSLQSPQWIHPLLDGLIRYSRRRELTVILTQHLVKDANDIQRGLASDFFFFETTDEKDLERIEFFTNAACRAAVEQLHGLEYVHFEVESEHFITNADPDSWKFKIRRELFDAALTDKEEAGHA